MIELAVRLIDIPSVSRSEQRITDWIAEHVSALPGIEIFHRQADALVFGPPGAVDVVLAGHSDTVPEQGNLPAREAGGVIHGLGASDMKGALAVMLQLAAALEGRHLNPLFVIFGREELPPAESVLAGLFDACPRILTAQLAVMMEPTGNALQAGCLGNLQAELVFEGVAAHSARPWLGVNAIHQAVRGLESLVSLEPAEVVIDGLVYREVVSVTQIAGGVANNVVPDRAVCGLNYRYAGTRTAAEAEAELRRLAPLGELRILGNSPGSPAFLGNPMLQRLRESGGLAVEPKQAWTPVAEFASRGLPAVNFGPGDPAFAHRRDEQVTVQALTDNLSILRRFMCS